MVMISHDPFSFAPFGFRNPGPCNARDLRGINTNCVECFLGMDAHVWIEIDSFVHRNMHGMPHEWSTDRAGPLHQGGGIDYYAMTMIGFGFVMAKSIWMCNGDYAHE